jgi:formylglycine-generating enzyme required for sulfatase activity/DNA-binding winged helix-turn-helix (wHTH) protein
MDAVYDRVYRFEGFTLDMTRRTLDTAERKVELRPKSFDVLCCLVEHAGQLVTKDRLFETVWPGATVSDESVTRCVSDIRAALSDREQRIIKTIPGRGYLLAALVSRLPKSSGPVLSRAGTNVGRGSDPPPRRPTTTIPAFSKALGLAGFASRWGADASRIGAVVQRSALRPLLNAPWLIPATALLAVTGLLVLGLAIGLPRLPSSAPAAREPAAKPAQKAARTFKDCDVCPEMVELPAGEFMMGSPADERGRDEVEGSQRRVVIPKRLALGKFEVTVAQFEAFVAETGLVVEDTCRRLNIKTGRFDLPTEGSFRQPGFDVSASHPVVCVSWHDAQSYAAWLGRRTGKPYRLPSEAEWEYAARAGTTASYSFGSDEGQLCDYGRFADLASRFPWGAGCRSKLATHGPLPVGTLKPNPWGLFDMHGNTWEWVADCWRPDARETPTDGTPFPRPGGCEVGVLRGGSWVAGYRKLRSAQRLPVNAAKRHNHIGFRVALSLGS